MTLKALLVTACLLPPGPGPVVLDLPMAFPPGPDTPTLWERLTPFMPWLALFWTGGTCLLQARLLLHWFRARQLRTHGTRPVPAWVRSRGARGHE